MPEKATVLNRSEKSAAVVVAVGMADEAETESEGPKEWYSLRIIEMVKPQIFTHVKLVTISARLKRARAWQRVKQSRRNRIQ